MSTTPNLNPHQMLQSHLVNCNICKKFSHSTIVDRDLGDGRKWFDTTTHENKNRMLCPVGLRLLELARKDDPNKVPSLNRTAWPFVAKLYQRIEVRVRGRWIEARVMDRSISARHYYEKKGEDGKLHHRTGAEKVVGYEVEADNGRRYFVNPGNIRKLPNTPITSVSVRGNVIQPPLGFNPGEKLRLVLRDVPVEVPSTPGRLTLHLGG
jgi:hypothetical protein